MAGSNPTFEKRQRERKKRERREEKLRKRAERSAAKALAQQEDAVPSSETGVDSVPAPEAPTRVAATPKESAPEDRPPG